MDSENYLIYKKETSRVFMSMTVLSVLEVILSFIFAGAFSLMDSSLALSGWAYENISALINIICIVLAASVLWNIKSHLQPGLKNIVFQRAKKASASMILTAAMVIFALQLLQIFPTHGLETLFNHFGFTFENSAYNETISDLSLVDTIYALCIATVTEEVVYRGIALRGLASYGKNYAIVVSAFIFSLAHADPNQFVYTFLAGLVFGFVCLNYSIFASILLHIINNAFAILANFTAAYDSGDSLALILGLVMFFSVPISLVLAFRHRYIIMEYIYSGRHIKGVSVPYVLCGGWFFIFIALQTFLTSLNISAL